MSITLRATVGYGIVVTAFLAGWHAKVTGSLTIGAITTLGAFAATCLLTGRACLARAPLSADCRQSPNLQFLAGFFGCNTLLFVLSMASPLGIVASAVVVSALAALCAASVRAPDIDTGPVRATPELIALAVSGLAATLWCRDGMTPIVVDGANAVFRLWGDSYIHARITSALAQATGLASLSDFRMSATPVSLYHYASYATPAALSALTGTPAYEIYASFLLPFGVLVTGVAAFALVRSWWGAWPGVAATVAVVLLPDAFQQGFGNRYLSYNFMQQVNVAGLYGVACAALAWLFVIRACRSGSGAALVTGIALAGFTLLYKAHVFVAVALPVLLYPCLFFPRPRPVWRAIFGACVVAIFAVALSLVANVSSVPVLRFDGSGAAEYVARLAWNYEPGMLQNYFAGVASGARLSGGQLAWTGLLIVLPSTFGIWLALAPVAGIALRNRTSLAILLFPALVVVNYLAMAFGLALDTRGFGAPDELLNRPLVWAYFVVAAWTGGALWFRVFGDGLPARAVTRSVLAIATAAALVFPWFLGRNLQTYPRWAGFETYASANSVPACLVSAARELRTASRTNDVFQDSENDPRFLVTALSDRQGYVAYTEHRPPEGMAARLRDLAAWRQMQDAAEVRRFAAERGIAWYLLRPTTAIAWPPEILAAPAFECDGFRIYRFAR